MQRGGIRERMREQVRDDVKRLALAQLAAQGPAGLSLNAIARELGVSGPALYRYFASRDALLTGLVGDAYGDLAEALAAALEAAARRSPENRLRAVAGAYRDWALAQPHRYRLLFAEPLPGYDAQADVLVAAAQPAMTTLLAVLRELPAPAGTPRVPPRLAGQLDRWAAKRGVEADAATAARAVGLWTRLHGFVGLELAGNFASMGLDPAPLFEREVEAVIG